MPCQCASTPRMKSLSVTAWADSGPVLKSWAESECGSRFAAAYLGTDFAGNLAMAWQAACGGALPPAGAALAAGVRPQGCETGIAPATSQTPPGDMAVGGGSNTGAGMGIGSARQQPMPRTMSNSVCPIPNIASMEAMIAEPHGDKIGDST